MDDVAILKKAKYLSNQSVSAVADTFGIELSKKKQSDANQWIPTAAVKKIKELQARHNKQMNETCISQILYEFNIIWRDIMRKES